MMVMVVVFVSAVAFVSVFMVVVVTAAAFVIMVVFMMTSAAALMIVFMMMSAAAFFMVVVMMVLTTATFFMIVVVMVMVMVLFMSGLVTRPVTAGIPRCDDHFPLHSTGNFRKLFDKAVGILRGDAELPGGKGDGCLPDLRQGVEFGFDLGGAVCAVQIVDDIDLPFHMYPP